MKMVLFGDLSLPLGGILLAIFFGIYNERTNQSGWMGWIVWILTLLMYALFGLMGGIVLMLALNE